MLPLFIATTEAAHDAGVVGIAEKLASEFGIEWGYVIWQVASFLILFVVLYKFGIKPTIATMEERNRKIESGLKNAEETQARLAAAAAESAALVKAASVEAQKIVDEARKAAKDFADKQQAEAIAHANDLIAKAKQSTELEHKKMLDQARGEIARLVVATTERVLAKKLSDADRAAYNETATKELTTV
jgi:F-type H+-transporting ATPase subunit b